MSETIGYWLTPPEIYKPLDEQFRFDFDPCPYPRPDGFDGLTAEWGLSNYCNPPFPGDTGGKLLKYWVLKAVEEHAKGKTVVLALPHYVFASITSPIWPLNPIVQAAGVRWIHPNGKRRTTPFLTVFFILPGRPKP